MWRHVGTTRSKCSTSRTSTRDAYNELCANRDMKMRKFEIEDKEWEIVRQLADILKVNYFSSHFRDDSYNCVAFQRCHSLFSRATPYLAKVIPAMDHIDQHLATAARNNAYKPCIQAAVAMGKKLLNKYYSYTDHSELYRIAMGESISRV
jgi:hypothetical protein